MLKNANGDMFCHIAMLSKEAHMPIFVELGSYYRKFIPSYDPLNGLAQKYRYGMTIADLLSGLPIPDPRSAIVTVNRSLVGPDYQLREGDHVGIFPAAWGG